MSKEYELPYTGEKLLELLGNIKTEEELRAFIQQYSSGGHTDEQIRIIVAEWYQQNNTQLTKADVDGWIEEYLTENPISGGLTTEQVNEIVAAYIRDNNISGSVSAEEIAQAVENYIAEHPITGVTTEDIQNAVNSYLLEHPVEGGTMDEDTFDEMADEWIENIKIAGANLPIVFLEGDMTGISKENAVPMKFRFVSQFKSFEETCTLKYQGTSSMGYPKKNFTVKLDSKHGVGWGKQKKYCLKANYIDHSHARNIVSARLWSQVVASRSDYAEMPELLRTSPNNGAVDGFPIRVYLNETYQGLYTMNVPKGSWQFKMDDTNENHCILCGENYVSGCFRGSANIDGTDWSDELHDIVPDSTKTRWNQVIDFVMNSTDEDFKANITNYIDLQSLIDYYIFAYVSTGLDALGKNQIYYTYDGQKFYASMYDMDSTWGMYYDGKKFVSDTYRMQDDYETKVNGRQGNLLYYRLEALFQDEIEARYNELRSSILSFQNILAEFEKFMSAITTEQYSEDITIYSGIPSSTTNNIKQIRSYVTKRLAYVDGMMRKVNVESIQLNYSSNEVYQEKSFTLTPTFTPSNANNYSLIWSADNDNVTVDNGKVTGVAVGKSIVTVTDEKSGNSASCTVTVLEKQAQESEWDVEWDGSTNELPSDILIGNADVIQLDDGSYGITTNTSAKNVQINNSISPTGILEVDFNRTANDTTKSWAFGFVIKDSANTRIEVHNFRTNALDDRLVTEVNQSKYIASFASNTVGYKIRLDLTTMKGTLSGGSISNSVEFDLVNKANTDTTNSYFYDNVTGTIVVTGIRYKR